MAVGDSTLSDIVLVAISWNRWKGNMTFSVLVTIFGNVPMWCCSLTCFAMSDLSPLAPEPEHRMVVVSLSRFFVADEIYLSCYSVTGAQLVTILGGAVALVRSLAIT